MQSWYQLAQVLMVAGLGASACSSRAIPAVADSGSDPADLTIRPRDAQVSTVTHLGGGGGHSCVVKGGELLCWGSLPADLETQPAEPYQRLPGGPFEASCGGSFHLCTLSSAGEVLCAGGNRYGQLGQGHREPSTTLLKVELPHAAKALDCGWGHTCALLGTGEVYCWGANGGGQSGVEHQAPALVPGWATSGATAVAGGGEHSCALTVNDTIECWGEGTWCQLGYGYEGQREDPRDVPGLDEMVAVSAEGNHSCAVRRDGRLFCWGDGGRGQVLPGATGFVQDATDVGLSGVTAVAVSPSHSCAMADGIVWCWGHWLSGLLAVERAPAQDGSDNGGPLPSAHAISAATSHACALTDEGVYCWYYPQTPSWDTAPLEHLWAHRKEGL